MRAVEAAVVAVAVEGVGVVVGAEAVGVVEGVGVVADVVVVVGEWPHWYGQSGG